MDQRRIDEGCVILHLRNLVFLVLLCLVDNQKPQAFEKPNPVLLGKLEFY